MSWWPFRKKEKKLSKHGCSEKMEEAAEERLTTIAPSPEINLEWDEREDTTDVVKLAAVEAEETATAAHDTLTESTLSLRKDARQTHLMVTGSLEFDIEALKAMAKAEG